MQTAIMTEAVAELLRIDAFVARLPLHPRRVFPTHHADAELMPLSAGSYLAATLDVLSEELTVGLYREPETMGWVLVQANLSDLAAVGAAPVGLVLGVSLGPEWDDERTARLASGIDNAVRSEGTYILGGDLNDAAASSLCACAIGLLEKPLISRHGVRPGDRIYASAPLGLGNAMAAAALTGHPQLYPERAFRPRARLRAGRNLRRRAHAMIDTSDGLLAALDQLARVNELCLELDLTAPRLVDERAAAVAAKLGLPDWALLFGEHGEYQLVFAADADAESALPLGAVPLGRARDGYGVAVRLSDAEAIPLDAGRIRNLRATTGGDAAAYISALLEYGTSLGLPGSQRS
jgi:thiamine-monophosphate kinase